MPKVNSKTVAFVEDALRNHPDVQLAIVFGSVAAAAERMESDVDVDIGRPLTAQGKDNPD